MNYLKHSVNINYGTIIEFTGNGGICIEYNTEPIEHCYRTDRYRLLMGTCYPEYKQ